jgi:hypothetical protein
MRLSLLLPAFSFPLNYFVKPLSALLCTAHLLPLDNPDRERLMHEAQNIFADIGSSAKPID